jgi:hypothetical protein
MYIPLRGHIKLYKPRLILFSALGADYSPIMLREGVIKALYKGGKGQQYP